MNVADTHLAIALSAAVPLHVIELQFQGGPTDDDIEKCRGFSVTLGERGDTLLFGSEKEGEAAALFNGVARAIAVMSFVPGGITIFGQHWESSTRLPWANWNDNGEWL